MPIVEIFNFDLDLEDDLPVLRSWLSPEELARAERLIDAAHTRRFIVAHGRLRQILGERLRRHPADVRFDIGPQGKPSVTGGGLHFNLSHSGRFGLIGLGDIELGVDVELVRSGRDELGIARRFFSPGETAWLAALDPSARPQGFCRLWTCKEAWLKADGRGLTLPLNQVEVSFPSRSAQLRSLGSDRRRWAVREIDLDPGCRAALVLAAPVAEADPVPHIELSFPPLPAISRSTGQPA